MGQGRAVYGIDLGTTYSCISQIDRFDQPVVLRNFEGDSITPSAVYFEDRDNIIIGKEAKGMLATEPENTVVFIKREMGNDAAFDKQTNLLPFHYDPSEISAMILKKLVDDANQQNHADIRDVVITCPAYFGTKERMQTKQAGEIAGLNVLSIINEPTAAAIAYGVKQQEQRSFIVYDLGGGTFDVTYLVADHGNIKVIATGGDHHLGGVDWDTKLAQYLLTAFNQANGTHYELTDDPILYNSLILEAESKKKLLTAKSSVKWNFSYRGQNVRMEITRQQFDEITSELLDQTIDALFDVLDIAAGKGYNQFDEILLVGGSSRMPQVKERIDSELNCDSRLNDPDEIVAKGAAIYAMNQAYTKSQALFQKGMSKERPAPLGKSMTSVVNVTSKTYGLKMLYSGTGIPHIHNFLFANTQLPCQGLVHGRTSCENQRQMSSSIYESDLTDPINDENVPVECGMLIDERLLNITQDFPKGTPSLTEFFVDEEGILSVRLTVGNDILDYTLRLPGVRSKEELRASKQLIAGKNIQ